MLMTLNRIKNVVISFYQGVKSSFGWAEQKQIVEERGKTFKQFVLLKTTSLPLA